MEKQAPGALERQSDKDRCQWPHALGLRLVNSHTDALRSNCPLVKTSSETTALAHNWKQHHETLGHGHPATLTHSHCTIVNARFLGDMFGIICHASKGS